MLVRTLQEQHVIIHTDSKDEPTLSDTPKVFLTCIFQQNGFVILFLDFRHAGVNNNLKTILLLRQKSAS